MSDQPRVPLSVTLRPIATPLPLGFLALAIATWVAVSLATLTSSPGAFSPGLGIVLIWRAVALLGVALALLSTYAALALELEETQGRTVLPLGRAGRARAALEEGLAEQEKGIEHEPGVRQQL